MQHLASTNPLDILNAARCFEYCVPPGYQNPLKTYLLSQVPSCTDPLAPNNLTIVLVTDTSISITWSQPLGIPPIQPDTYVIRWGTVSGVYTHSDSVSGATFAYSMTGLDPNTTYFFVVEGFSGICSATSAESSTTTEPAICVDGTGVANNWAARVVANGGAAPSDATKVAIANFVCGLIADGIYTKFIAINVMAPDNIAAAYTPLIVGPGSGLWSDPSPNHVTLTINGLVGDAGNSAFVRTGVKTTDFAPATTGGFAWYCYNGTATGFDIGSYNEVVGCLGAGDFTDAKAHGTSGATAGGTPNTVAVATSGNGYYCDNRVSGIDHRLFFANSLNPHAQIGATDVVAWAGPFVDNADGMILFAINDSLGSQQLNSNDTISFVAWFNGFTATDSANLFARVQTLRTAFGGGFR